MRFMSLQQVCEAVLYSRAHIARLEEAGTFPKRVKLGQHRVGWVESEIMEWMQKRIDERDIPTDPSR